MSFYYYQLEKAREATDEANLRSAYAECVTSALTGTEAADDVNITTTDGVTTATKDVELKQQVANWLSDATPEISGVTLGNTIAVGANVTVTVDSNGNVSFTQGSTNLAK